MDLEKNDQIEAASPAWTVKTVEELEKLILSA